MNRAKLCSLEGLLRSPPRLRELREDNVHSKAVIREVAFELELYLAARDRGLLAARSGRRYGDTLRRRGGGGCDFDSVTTVACRPARRIRNRCRA